MEILHKTDKTLSWVSPEPLGATLTDAGVNFAVYSQYAAQVFLLLFNHPQDVQASDMIKMERTQNVWHVFISGLKAGHLYGYRVVGEYNPFQGKRFNPYKLLIDPYAKALTGKFDPQGHLLFGYDVQADNKDLTMDQRDSTQAMPKCIVIDDRFDWQGDLPPAIPMDKLVIYEAHVKGYTAHPSSKVKDPGTYLGFIEKIPHLQRLGINAVELMPVHQFYVQDFLLKKGLTNFWGYDSVGFFAPEVSFSTNASIGCQVQEFKTLVRQLHKAGIEVILDVVYNHTAEGNELGPTLCFKGLDNPSYYLLRGNSPEDPYRYYTNDTGCGNTINAENPAVMQMVLDSLRYWVQVMRVDGFRFDLAVVLAKVQGKFDRSSAFFDAVANDPVLSTVKMIAEPWDLTSYQVGNFPPGWSEWNGKFRDTVRRFLKGDEGQVPDLASRISGSADMYQNDGRKPYSSVNFITCHDGFTLNDLVSYNGKHNEANGEENRDGSDDNNSWNCGAEGETSDAAILKLRRQQAKNALCLLFFSSGVPMMLSGDEIMHSKKGNNNTWCQDNELNWDSLLYNPEVLEFCRKAIELRRHFSILQRRRFFSGEAKDRNAFPDIAWFGTRNLKPPKWESSKLKTLCFQLSFKEDPAQPGDDYLFFIFNANYRGCRIHLPQHEGKQWHRLVNTARRDDIVLPGHGKFLRNQGQYYCDPRSVVVLFGKK